MQAPAQIYVLQEPKQARSRARRAALIECGVEFLNERELDEFSVAEITHSLGYSTGSFYSYFQDKTAFFIAVQEWVNEDLIETLVKTIETQEMAQKNLTERLSACVDFALSYFRKHTGVICSALRYERRIPQGWAPNRATTQRLISAAVTGLGDADRQRLETALQLAFGMLVNALLHDPGPLRLNGKDMGPKIIMALKPYLSTEQE